ncbi:MAG TPA: glycosyltransferase [Candidatus Eisenbacteria bacterium]|nr:glycosyltransferase [Candidatus Eisenbacteria bacterium]
MAGMKVALLGPTYPHRGGIAHYTTLLARAFAERLGAASLSMVSFRRLYPGILFPGATQFDESGDALRPPVEPAAILDSIAPPTWYAAGRRLCDAKPDLLVVPWWHPFFGPSLGAAARGARPRGAAGPKRVFLCHNVEPHEATPLDRALSSYGLGAADGFLVHARAEAARLEPRAHGRPIRVHPHPTYDVFSRTPPDRDAARDAVGAKGRTILFFGYIRPYKGLADLLEALRLARPDAWDTLLVVGEFYEPRDRYAAALDDPALRGKVRVVDRYVANEEVAAYFAAADVVALPYRSATGSGIAQVAYGAGVPVIATRTGGLEEVVEEGVTGLLAPPEEPAALARAVERYFDGGLAPALREGVARARARYGWSALVDALVALAGECR